MKLLNFNQIKNECKYKIPRFHENYNIFYNIKFDKNIIFIIYNELNEKIKFFHNSYSIQFLTKYTNLETEYGFRK